MSILSTIMSKIFDASEAAATTPAPAGSAGAPASAAPEAGSPAARSPGAAPAAARSPGTMTTAPAAAQPVDVEVVLIELASRKPQQLNWRTSIVDLMKLLDLDSSLTARQELARELHYSGDLGDTASMNIWLHKRVMLKLAENGGRVPDDLKN